MTENIFEKAVRNKVRFQHRGQISAEDLWDLSLTALDKIYMDLRRQVVTAEGESLLNTRSQADELLELQIEVIKYIVATKQAELAERKTAAAKKLRNERISNIIQEKQDNALYEMSLEDLQKLLEE